MEIKKPELWKVAMEFVQPADDLQDGTLEQRLTIETEDGGAGKYFFITTERWAFDKVEELVELVEKVKAAIGEEK